METESVSSIQALIDVHECAASTNDLTLVPVNAARQTSKLMMRLPRRTRAAPLIALIPRSVMVPLLVAAAAFFLGVTFTIGACAIGAMVTTF